MHDNGDESTKGTVVAQDPARKSEARSGSTVTVTINDAGRALASEAFDQDDDPDDEFFSGLERILERHRRTRTNANPARLLDTPSHPLGTKSRRLELRRSRFRRGR